MEGQVYVDHMWKRQTLDKRSISELGYDLDEGEEEEEEEAEDEEPPCKKIKM
jgi:hypothetical protein